MDCRVKPGNDDGENQSRRLPFAPKHGMILCVFRLPKWRDLGGRMKVVVDNSTPEGRQRALEARVQIGFAEVTSKVLEFLASGEPNGFADAMRAAIRKALRFEHQI
jgi:hypothetical protein